MALSLGKFRIIYIIASALLFSVSSLTVTQANVLLANTVLGSSTTTQDPACGWLVTSGSNLPYNGSNTVDVIFKLGANANVASDQALFGGPSGSNLNVLIAGNQSFRVVDVDYGTAKRFYLQAGNSFVRGTTYHLAVQSLSGVVRVWVNGVAMTTNSSSDASANLSTTYVGSPSQIFNTIGDFYTHGGGFQGTISYLRSNSTNLYAMTDTVTMASTLTNVAFTQFLMTPTTYIPTYALITNATYSNPNVTFTAANNFAAGDSVTIKSALVSGYNKSNVSVLSASGSSFTVNYGASSPGTWSGLGDAVTTAVTKDDTGNTPITWVDAVCQSSTSSPGIVVVAVATPSILTGGSGSIYRKSTTLRVTMPADGRITFYAQGKPIPGCKNFAALAGIASCIWKPSLHGTVSISAVMTLTSAPLVSVSPGYLQVNVDARSDNR